MKRILIGILCLFMAVGATQAQNTSPAEIYKTGKKYYDQKEYSKAIGWYSKAAEQGNSDAQNALGDMYYYGHGVTLNYTEAVKWYRKAVEKGHIVATDNLGYMYLSGYGVKKNYNESIKYFQKAAEQDDTNGQYHLAYSYKNGYGIQQDYKEAAKWFEKAAKKGNSISQNELGDMYYYGQGIQQSYNEAIKWYREAAKRGNSTGEYNLGHMYNKGYGIEKDYKEAAKWFESSAAKGNTSALYELGNQYYYGYGVEKDQEKAVEWYKKAADKNNSVAQNALGIRYYKGEGVPQDYKQAVYWFEKSAKNGYYMGQYNLGSCYQSGDGVEKDERLALSWFKKSADQGYKDAQNKVQKINPDFSKMTANEIYELSSEYRIDWMTSDDENEKKESLKKHQTALEYAVGKGEVNAQVALGANYLEGRDGYSVDYAKAKHWLEQAARSNKKGAPYYLGVIYYEGKGVSKDYKKAFNYFTIAANNDVKRSKYYLALCYEYGHGTKKNIPGAIEYYIKAEMNEEALRLKKAHNLLTDDDRYEMAVTFYAEGKYDELYTCVKNASSSHDGCMLYLGVCYDRGLVVEKNRMRAAEIYKTIADKNQNAKSLLSDIYMDKKENLYNPEEGIKLLRELEKEEYIWAYNDLGNYYMDGVGGITKDEKQGFEYYKKSAENGATMGMNNLGWAYLYGKGTKQDYTLAMEWFQKAVQGGYEVSYGHIGNCYFYGWGVQQDYVEAIANYKKAIANTFYPNAGTYCKLGECYLVGRGVAQDYKQAVQMFEKAQKENSLANFYLAICYEIGLGVEKDMQKSQSYMQKVEELGYPIAIQMKGLDAQGNWSVSATPDDYNYQTIYTVRTNSGYSNQRITITGTTLRNIHQRVLSTQFDQSEELAVNLPSVFGVERKQNTAQPTVETQLAAGQPPKVHILSHSDNMMFNQTPLEMKYFIDTPDEAPMLELLVKINGKLQPNSRGLSFGEPITLSLPEEDCNIVFQARNKYGYGPAEVINLKWDDSKERMQRPNLYVLAVGIDEYEHLPKLKYAVKDMNDFIETVENKKLSPYGEIMVKRLPNQMAKRQNIEEGLEWLKEMATDKDFSFVYYAGHGLKDERDRFHFVPIDGKKERMSSTCISAQRFIDDYLSTIAGKVIVFTDACYSGALLDGRRGSASDAFTDDIIKVMMRSNADIMFYSSTSADTVANELAEESNGAFTKALLEAFKGEGTQQDKRVLTTMDLQNYLRNRVRKLSKDQVPNFRVERDVPLFTY